MKKRENQKKEVKKYSKNLSVINAHAAGIDIGDSEHYVAIEKGYIKTKGSWGDSEEIKTWTDVKNIKLSPDWNKYHYTKDKIKSVFNDVKQDITGKDFGHGSYGIHSPEVDDSCREAFDIIQVIRHEFWKENPKRSTITVDSSISLTSPQTIVKVELDTISEIRKDKLKKIKKSE